jgi:hypothetical protein
MAISSGGVTQLPEAYSRLQRFVLHGIVYMVVNMSGGADSREESLRIGWRRRFLTSVALEREPTASLRV